MKKSQKRTCNGCQAWNCYDSFNVSCSLGYVIETDKIHIHNSSFVSIKSTPQEPCPKPKTIKQLCKEPAKWERAQP